METELKNICDKLMRNTDVVGETIFGADGMLCTACAMMFMEKGRDASAETLKECKDILVENTGFFSNFRAITKLPLMSAMSLASDPKEKVRQTVEFYSILKDHFMASEYLALGAVLITDRIEEYRYEEVAKKAKSIYKQMKKCHPFLTSSEDVVICLLLAIGQLNEDELMKESEACYRLLKSHFFSANCVQALSNSLTLIDGTAQDKVTKVLHYFNLLKENGYKYGKTYELASLAPLVSLDIEDDLFIEKFTEVNEYLEDETDYGIVWISKKQRYMHVVFILQQYFGSSYSASINALNTTMAIIISQQIAMVAAIAAINASTTTT